MSTKNRLKAFLGRRLMILGLVICAPVIGTLTQAWELWGFSRSPVSASKLARLRPGMYTQSVEKILGKPSRREVFTNFNGTCTEWTYSNPGNWKFVCIYFDGKGGFANYIED